MKSILFTHCGTTYRLRMKISHYGQNGNLYIQLYPEGGSAKTLTVLCQVGNTVFATPAEALTINTGLICPKNCAFINTKNSGRKILDWLADNHLAVPTGRRTTYQGWLYLEYQFDPKILREFDPDGYKVYLKGFGKAS